MNKFLPILIIALFIFCAVFGYIAAEKLNLGGINPTTEKPIEISSTQQNYLFVHVDDLTTENPQLIAMWGVLVYYSQPPQLMILPFYPSYDETKSADLSANFSILQDKSLPNRFIKAIESQLNLSLTGYVVVDNIGLSKFVKLVTGQEIQLTAFPARTADEKHILLYNGQEFFKAFCARLASEGSKSFIEKMDWTEILPGHFTTNLSFETITLAMDTINNAGKIDQCNVLSSE